jgi:hypothetical protein
MSILATPTSSRYGLASIARRVIERTLKPRLWSKAATYYAVLVKGANGDSWRCLVRIVELKTHAHTFFSLPCAAYGRMIYTVIYLSDHLLTQANPNPHLAPPHQNCVESGNL